MANNNDTDQGHDVIAGEVLDVSELQREISPYVAAEINQQVATAKRYPRPPDSKIIDEIYGRATLNEAIAGECMYSLQRDSKALTGPSIRFAEIVRASYGNIRVASRFVRIDADDPARAAVIVEAIALDLQSNQSETIGTRRSIMTSAKGGARPRMYSADMINTTINAGASIARRNAILAVVPKNLWIEPFQGAVSVVRGDSATLFQRRKNAFEALSKFNISAEDLLDILECRSIEDVSLDHLPVLRGMLTAIREGEPPASVLGRFGTETPVQETVKHPLRDPPRLNIDLVAKADTVIGPDSKIIKQGLPAGAGAVLDQRFAPGKQYFEHYAVWQKAAENMPDVENLPAMESPDQASAAAQQLGDEGAKQGERNQGGGAEDPGIKSGGNITTGPQGPGKAAEAGSGGPASDTGREPNIAQDRRAAAPDAQKPDTGAKLAAAGSDKPYEMTAGGYMSWMRDELDTATSGALIEDIWGRTRTDRQELLNDALLAELTKDKKAKVASLKLKKGGGV